MDFLTLKLFPSNLVEAIGSTLIHSLWQGVLLSAITGLIIVFTRKSRPAIRYNLLISAFVLFVSGVAVTFAIVFSPTTVSGIQSHQNNTVTFQHTFLINQLPYDAVTIPQPSFKELTIGYINKNANSIVLIWFVIVCARSLQLASGLNGLYYLRRKSIYKIDDALEARVKELAFKLGILRVVGIAQSGIAKVPIVIGHLKPLILIPIGLITTLSAEEVEAILIHELAHIRRRDYLVNILQSFMEIIFFFNPAVLWISALIKTERENCCDDIVVAQSSSKADYIKALISCQEYHLSAPAYAMALTGNKKHLLTRVKRMLSNNNQSLNMMEKSLLAVCLVSAGLLTAAFSNADKINTLVTKTANAVAHIAKGATKKEPALKIEPKNPVVKAIENDTLFNKTDTPKDTKFKIYRSKEIAERASVSVQNGPLISQLYKQDGILYQLNYKDKVFSTMQVNGKTIPNDHLATYESIIDQIQRKNNMAVAKPSGAIYVDEKPGTGISQDELRKFELEAIQEKVEQEKANAAQFSGFVTYGDDYSKQGEYTDALEFYKKAESINPLNPALEKKIIDTKNAIEKNKTPEEKQKDLDAKVKADNDNKSQEQFNAFIAYGDYYNTKQKYQDAMDDYKKAEAINPHDPKLEEKIDYTQKLLNQYVGDSVNQAYGNGSITQAKKARVAATAPIAAYSKPGVYAKNYAYTDAGKSETARKDSINRANIMNDMMKDDLIQTLDNLSFKISTEEFIVNGKKQPDNIYQKYRAKYVKVVGHGDWSWYYNFDTAAKKTTNTTIDNTNSKD